MQVHASAITKFPIKHTAILEFRDKKKLTEWKKTRLKRSKGQPLTYTLCWLCISRTDSNFERNFVFVFFWFTTVALQQWWLRDRIEQELKLNRKFGSFNLLFSTAGNSF